MTRFLLPCGLLLAAITMVAAPEFPKMGPDIYDPHASGAAQIDTALREAKAAGKNVLLDFGANWCIWCRRLQKTMTDDANVRAALEKDFVVVMIDLNTRNGVMRNADLNQRYGNVLANGIPVLVVLDAEGKQLVTQDSGELEDGKDAHDPAKIVAFLEKWSPAK